MPALFTADAGITGHGTAMWGPSAETTHSLASASTNVTLPPEPEPEPWPSATCAAAIIAWPAPPWRPEGE